MANDNATTSSDIVDAKSPEGKNFLSDPAVWAKRGNKIVHGNVLDLKPDTSLNVRFRAGSSYLGINFTKDTLDIPSMKQGIVDGDGIHEAILVSVRANGEKVPLRGNRRTFAGQELANDPATPAELRKALTERTPMILMSGLTPEQEQTLVNDQTQKQFLKSELVRQIIGIRKQGWSFDKIAMLLWEQMGRFSRDGLTKLAEVRDIVDPVLKREKIKLWLRGTLDNYLLWAIDLGPWMQKQLLLSEMRLDGILPASTPENPVEQPYFYTNVNSQKRVAALKKAKEADGTKFNGLMLVEGTEFKKLADEYHNIDFGNVAKTPKPETVKMLGKDVIGELKKTATSKTVQGVLSRILGEEVPDYQIRDEAAAIFETKAMLVEQYVGRLKPEMKAVIRTVFMNPDPTDFQKFLESHSEPEVPAPAPVPVTEAQPHPDAVNNETFSLTDNANAG